MTHISLELAKWLKERGCDLPSQYVWTQASTVKKGSVGKWYLSTQKYGEYRAYSWYDILVTHRTEFFGKEAVDMPDETHTILYFLQTGETQKAEDYVRKYSVFANPKP